MLFEILSRFQGVPFELNHRYILFTFRGMSSFVLGCRTRLCKKPLLRAKARIDD
jgi:hypothetical protein